MAYRSNKRKVPQDKQECDPKRNRANARRQKKLRRRAEGAVTD